MIPHDFLTEWRAQAPWTDDAQVEQDLVISRALVEIYRRPGLARELAFRGGTALHKLHLGPPTRYSEDIDLVQVTAGPIGAILAELRDALDPWLGAPRWKLKEGRVNLVYHFDAETSPPTQMRLKVEINSREHFSQFGLVHLPYVVRSRWFEGSAEIATYDLDELLGTKLRALYQRKKGRDLYDLALALERGAHPDRILACFARYMAEGGHSVTRAMFEQNLADKRTDVRFTADLAPLLRSGGSWDLERALQLVSRELVERLPGQPWKGVG